MTNTMNYTMLPKSKDNVQNIMTGNGQIKTHFWIEIPVNIQGVLMQLKCLVCDSRAPHGLLLSRLALNQMHAIQLYDKRHVIYSHKYIFT